MSKKILIVVFFQMLFLISFSQGIIIDHNCTNLGSIPQFAIENAKQTLNIAYEHTSHGSQLITGMTGLVGQTNLVGYQGDIYQWSETVSNSVLTIDDEFTGGGDLGHNGDLTWATNTRTYLNDATNSDVNVVIWSWCGGVSDNTTSGIQAYLDEMNSLEQEYPNVKFVYMTGHADIWEDANVKANNQQIRDYCIANNKILYDFYDIETYNPDGTFFEFVNDDCGYYDQAGGSELGNWATEWQNSHTEGVDWYSCTAAHSHSLNANRKAYAAWWLWCRLAGWDGTSSIEHEKQKNNHISVFPNPAQEYFNIEFYQPTENIIVVYDLLGKQIKSYPEKTCTNRKISLKDLPKSNYIIVVKDKEQNELKSFIINKK